MIDMYCGIPHKKIRFDADERKMIWELLISLNKGNSGSADSRVDMAIKQYEQFKEETKN